MSYRAPGAVELIGPVEGWAARHRALVECVKMVFGITRGRAYYTNFLTLGQFILMDFLKRKTTTVS